MQNLPYLQPLRDAILSKTNFKKVNLLNCRTLREKIYHKTGIDISEIMIMRLYGLVPAKFEPTWYALHALVLYCGYQDWRDFCDCQKLTSLKKEQSN